MSYLPGASYAPVVITAASQLASLTRANDDITINLTTPAAVTVTLPPMDQDHPYRVTDGSKTSQTYPITLAVQSGQGDGKLTGAATQTLATTGGSLTALFNGTTTNLE